MIGVLINAAAIVVGGIFGLLFNKGIPQKLSDALMTSIGLCVMAIGITGIMKGQNTLVLIMAAVWAALKLLCRGESRPFGAREGMLCVDLPGSGI